MADGQRKYMKAIRRTCGDLRRNVEMRLKEANIYEGLKEAAAYLASRPLLLVGCIVAVTALVLPLLLFTLFAIITVAFTFTGFVIFEGTLLVFGTIVLCGVLLSIITSLIMMGLCFAMIYYIFLYFYTTIKALKMPAASA